MSFFERWFGAKNNDWIQPAIRFGRYSDAYKASKCYDAWDEALDAFEDGKFLKSLELFFTFLRDETEDNVRWKKNEQGISFEFFQGSKRIIGWASSERLRIEGRIARIIDAKPELLRQMIERNYALKFGRYALDPDQHITIVFDTIAQDASPYKLYYAFKEIATQADKQDDLILEEFGQMEAVDSFHLEPLPQIETKVKHQFIVNKIKRTLAATTADELKEYPGAIAFLLLDLIYKIDYLTKPEGYSMECLERMHRQFFSKDETIDAKEKNEFLIQELTHLLERSEKEYSKEMYRIKTTFGITNSVTHDRLVNLIDGELNEMDWYMENGYPKVAASIPSYLIGYGLFNYALPLPDRDFFHLFYRITEADFFKSLGFKPDLCDGESGLPDRKTINKAIAKIVKKHQNRYPNLRPAVSQLVFDNIIVFSKSYLQMVKLLDLTRLD